MLEAAHLRRVARLEALPINAPGADKSWVDRLVDALSQADVRFVVIGVTGAN